LSLGLGACGPSKQDVALAEAKAAMAQACEDSETAIKIAGMGYENGLNDVLALKAELLENIQGDNPTDWRKKYSDFSSQLVAVRQDFVVNYGDLRETYGSECTNASRRAEFNDTYVFHSTNGWLYWPTNSIARSFTTRGPSGSVLAS
jgi:hypothetical protein